MNGDWVDVIDADKLEPGDVTPVTVGSRRLAIYDAVDGIYATLALCTHGGADLCDGYFDGHVIECPLHQGCFDIRDGRALYAPATRDIKTFPARVMDGKVQVQV
jgi:3-phenylpropionate/trans-cinnamate dioxygenase ferredoxin subunit/naphthalene 1,2-dioxygenase system ferredoxin subunit